MKDECKEYVALEVTEHKTYWAKASSIGSFPF